MGLAGRKEKQRIGVDPRNTTWADDASRFGKAYLEKFGWADGTGLGADGDGRTSHLKVMHKLDLMGIGANRTREGDEGGQGRDYERLLKRLNESGISTPTPPEDSESTPPAEAAAEEERPKKKRKKSKEAQPEEGESEPPKPLHVPRPMAHRSKFLRSKNMAKNSQTALNEILGISTSARNTPPPTPPTPILTDPNSETSSGTQTPASAPPTSDQPHLLSTSTKSVADYFAEKLAARKKSTLSNSVTPTTPATPPEPEASSSVEAARASGAMDVQQQKEERRKRKKEKKAKDNEQTEVESNSKKDKKRDKKSKKKSKEGEDESNPPVDQVEGDRPGGPEDQREKKKKKKRKATNEASSLA